jgi:hypothetical protein
MGTVLCERTLVEIPLDVPNREALIAVLREGLDVPRPRQARRVVPPPDVDAVPAGLHECLWQRFFLAARAMVARHTPQLLELWDLRAAELAREDEDDDGGVPLNYDVIRDLVTIMERPEAAKLGLKGIPVVGIFERAKAAFAHCKRLRRRHGPRAPYEPMVGKGAFSPALVGPFPTIPLPTASLDFYRLALRQVFGTQQVPCGLRFLEEWFSADRVSDQTLERCLRVWDSPPEAARTLLASLTGLKPKYLAQVISAGHRSRRRRR